MNLKRTDDLRRQAIPRGYSARWGASMRLQSARQMQRAGPEHVSAIVARVMAALRRQLCLPSFTQTAPSNSIIRPRARDQGRRSRIPKIGSERPQ